MERPERGAPPRARERDGLVGIRAHRERPPHARVVAHRSAAVEQFRSLARRLLLLLLLLRTLRVLLPPHLYKVERFRKLGVGDGAVPVEVELCDPRHHGSHLLRPEPREHLAHERLELFVVERAASILVERIEELLHRTPLARELHRHLLESVLHRQLCAEREPARCVLQLLDRGDHLVVRNGSAAVGVEHERKVARLALRSPGHEPREQRHHLRLVEAPAPVRIELVEQHPERRPVPLQVPVEHRNHITLSLLRRELNAVVRKPSHEGHSRPVIRVVGRRQIHAVRDRIDQVQLAPLRKLLQDPILRLRRRRSLCWRVRRVVKERHADARAGARGGAEEGFVRAAPRDLRQNQAPRRQLLVLVASLAEERHG
mmetsp:Transcript_4082/g.14276  ORF Transcript_4082/g.14276 Transcript_4082/m.14276 type:complete len:373 (+) Transcript_4082:51-1169(+)